MVESKNENPRILAFVCNWCAYGATESAGVTEREYPPNIKMVRVMCSGRVERKLILNAIEEGIDGIIILACNIGNCHYMDGNKHAENRIKATSHLLGSLGVDKRRIKFQQIRASEGDKLGEILTDFSSEIRKIKK
ncbi:MAG: hydrogenase iron-sulfur subunit [Candidatus Lokiarchaeota archaeon]|nr:hydrogenase iron-sulfur subunit [Candidatus Lokiarchaeota archaeon]